MELVSDRDRLVAALRERGVDYLAPSDAGGAPVADEALIASLAASEDARLRQSLIALFLLRPHLAACVPQLRGSLDARTAQELVAHYLAAVYLQAMWRVRLERYLPSAAALPDYFSQELRLPAPQAEYGKAGLYALADWHSRVSPRRAHHRSEYESAAGLLLGSLKAKARRHVVAPAG